MHPGAALVLAGGHAAGRVHVRHLAVQAPPTVRFAPVTASYSTRCTGLSSAAVSPSWYAVQASFAPSARQLGTTAKPEVCRLPPPYAATVFSPPVATVPTLRQAS